MWEWPVKTSQCFCMHQFTNIRVMSQWLMVETHEPSEMSEPIRIRRKKTTQEPWYENDHFGRYSLNSHFVTVTVTPKTYPQKCWKHQNRLNKSSCTLGIMKNGPCEGHLWLNVHKSLSVISHNFSRKRTLRLVTIHTFVTILHFELKKLGRRKPRFGKICVSFSIKIPLHMRS